MKKLLVFIIVGLWISSCSTKNIASSSFIPKSRAPASDVKSADHPYARSRPIAGQYIVVFKNTVGNPRAEAAQLINNHGGKLLHTYFHSIKGFSAQLSDAAVEALLHNPNIDYIEQDMIVSLQTTQESATWGLDRIDQKDLPTDTKYNYNATGDGVYAFIIDTGIRPDHTEFSGRLLPGFTAINDSYGTNDCNGHGTHVTGTLGGTTYGVAKKVSLIPVRVLDCNGSGTWSGVVAGIDFVAGSSLRPAVANLSLGGAPNSALDAAISAAISKGVNIVVAAGNSTADACNYSPSRVPTAITVGATGPSDTRATYSNYGACVDIFAPGDNITSAWNTSSAAINTIAGTSMASPHVAGVVALALQANPSASPAMIESTMLAYATTDRLSSSSLGSSSPNLLVYSLLDSGGGTPPDTTQLTIAVKSITGSSVKASKLGTWQAKAVITVRNTNTNGVMVNASVSGSFSAGGSGSCVTDSSGRCTLTSSTMKSSVANTTFKVNGLSGTNMIYDASRNWITQLVIRKP